MVAAVPNPVRSKSSTKTDAQAPTWKRRVRRVTMALLVIAVASIPWTGPRMLAHLDYFRLRQVEFEGVQYVRPSELRATITVDSTWSVWNNLDTIARAVTSHPLIAGATVERRFPGGLLVRIVEHTPVAQVQSRNGALTPMSADARALPIEASRVPLDLPIAMSADTVLLRALDELRRYAPAIYARVVLARREGPDHLVFDVQSFLVRTRDDVTVARFRDILPVEADLARNQLRVVELDLRFQNQVIVRQP